MTYLRLLAAHCVRGLHLRLPSKIRGRREDRVHAAPAVSCAMCTRKCAHEHTGSAETLRPSLRNGFTAYIVLSPATGFLATVARGSLASANLTPASGRQDHTILPYASGAFVLHALGVHRISPHVRDDREPPLLPGETRGFKPLICPTCIAEYFLKWGLTGFADLPDRQSRPA